MTRPESAMTHDDIRLLIARTGLTQAGVAAVTGVRPGTVAKWLAGKMLPLPEHVARLEALSAAQDQIARAAARAAAAMGPGPLTVELDRIAGMPSREARLAVARRIADLIAPREVQII